MRWREELMGDTNGNKSGTGEDPLKRITIGILTFIFIALYVVGIYGVWNGDTAANAKAITLLQPIVYVIIGYYFGRLPSEKTEKQLKDQADEKGKQADDAKATATVATTKLRTVKTLLSGAAASTGTPEADGFAKNLSGVPRDDQGTLKVTVAHAINVIDQ
jgi:hypothetical protein